LKIQAFRLFLQDFSAGMVAKVRIWRLTRRHQPKCIEQMAERLGEKLNLYLLIA